MIFLLPLSMCKNSFFWCRERPCVIVHLATGDRESNGDVEDREGKGQVERYLKQEMAGNTDSVLRAH